MKSKIIGLKSRIIELIKLRIVKLRKSRNVEIMKSRIVNLRKSRNVELI